MQSISKAPTTWTCAKDTRGRGFKGYILESCHGSAGGLSGTSSLVDHEGLDDC